MDMAELFLGAIGRDNGQNLDDMEVSDEINLTAQ